MISERDLLDLIRQSAIGRYCRVVDVLPALTERGLLEALGKPPAVFASVREVGLDGELATVRYGLWIIAQNFRGHQAARQGDGQAVGLYDLAEGVMAAILGAPGYRLESFRPDAGEYSQQYGVHTGELTCSIRTGLPESIDLPGRLAEFRTFHADLDIPPHTPAAHAGWLTEPPDHSAAAPDAVDTVSLNP